MKIIIYFFKWTLSFHAKHIPQTIVDSSSDDLFNLILGEDGQQLTIRLIETKESPKLLSIAKDFSAINFSM